MVGISYPHSVCSRSLSFLIKETFSIAPTVLINPVDIVIKNPINQRYTTTMALHSTHTAESPSSTLSTQNILHKLGHLGTVNYHNPDLFETIGNHSHVRSLELSWSQDTSNRKANPLLDRKCMPTKGFGHLTLLTEREIQLWGNTKTKAT